MTSRYQEIVEFVGDLENRYPVDRWEVRGVSIWPLVRIPLAFAILAGEDFKTNNQISKYQGRWARAAQILRALLDSIRVHLRDTRANARIDSKADVVFLICSTTRFFTIAKRWYTPYADSFVPHLERMGLRTFVLETTADAHYRVPRYRASKFVQASLFVRQLFAAVVVRWTDIPSKLMQQDGLPELFAEVARRYPSSAKAGLPTVGRRALFLFWAAKYFERTLRKLRPKVALNDGYYSIETMAFQLACRRAGVKSIEVQHGVQGEHHFAYRRWSKIPARGYELLPDLFWVWGEDERRNIAAWVEPTAGRHSVMIGGNPVLHIAADDAEQRIFDMFLERARGSGSLNIVFTMQAFFSVPEFILRAVDLSPSSWTWWFRVHPQYWETREKIREILSNRGLLGRILLDEASDLPMVLLLQHMDVHITEFSSSVVEAEAVGVPSVVMAEQAKSLFVPQFERGNATFADTTEKLLQAIESFARLRGPNRAHEAEALFLRAVSKLGQLASIP